MWKSGKLETEGGVGHRGHRGGRRTLSIDHLAYFAAKKAELRAAGDEKGLLKLGHEMVLYDMSRQAAKNVQSVFNSLPYFKGQKNG